MTRFQAPNYIDLSDVDDEYIRDDEVLPYLDCIIEDDLGHLINYIPDLGPFQDYFRVLRDKIAELRFNSQDEEDGLA